MYRAKLDEIKDMVMATGEYDDLLDAIGSCIVTTAEAIASSRDVNYNMVLMALNEIFLCDQYDEEEIITELRDAEAI